MALRSLQTFMENSFHAPAPAAIDATFRLAIDDETLTFKIRHGKLEFVDSAYYDATFYFPDADTARALLAGQADVSEAFMKGRFRADGYLMWAFALLAMFRDPGVPANTTE
ncbi:MAG: SCP2 sterol-binding domain-containing protein [Pseudomonadales bacterium]